ncbi:MAG: hypothetical protein WCO56_12005 [Verrucomicrobiota bacterium]
MKTLAKWLLGGFLVLIALLVIGLLSMDTIARWVAEAQLKHQTGLDIKIGKLEVGIFHPRFRIEHLVAYNRPEFGGSPMVVMPELLIEYDRDAMLSHTLHLNRLRLNLAEFHLVENATGLVNVAALYDAMTTKAPSLKEENPKFSDFNRLKMQFGGIDSLEITVGKFKNTRLLSQPEVSEYEIGLSNRVFTNLQTELSLLSAMGQLALEGMQAGNVPLLKETSAPPTLLTNRPPSRRKK